MNDPGLDGPIQNEAEKVEHVYDSSNEEGEDLEEEQAFLKQTRWWFASTAFPLLAGTFGPMANAFSICALVQNWRVSIPPGGTEEHGIDHKDPEWLLAINGISLSFALISNASLLLNMARRLSFKIAQPITIVGWYLSSILLIGIISPMETPALHLRGVKDQALTQAYYYAIFAATIYFIISTLMVINVYGAYKGHYSKDFSLTISQRTLMLQTISFLGYMLCGAAVYAHVEGWMYLDAVYFCNVTLLTIGLGDYSPSTHLGRGLLFPYAVGGIVILGLVVGSIRSLVLERGKKKLSARIVEKTRKKVLKKIASEDENKGLNLDPIEKNANGKSNAELHRRKQEFYAMRKIQQMAANQRKWVSLCLSGGAWFFLWFIGAVAFWKAERNQNWTYFESLYFAYISLLTIGYGDFHPYSNFGKPFFVFWSLLAVPTLTVLISNMGDTVVQLIKDLTIWIGEVTFLPGDASATERLRYGAHKATAGKFLKDNDIEDIPPPGIAGGRGDEKKRKHGSGQDRIAAALEQEEIKGEQDAREKGDKLGEDIHHYHYLLVKDIRKVYRDLNASPEKRYSFKEWAWFLKLIGEDESSAKFHRAAPVDVDKKLDQAPEMGKAQEADDDGEVRQWSWLGNRSPLMGEKPEPEWVLERLCQTLEDKLREEREKHRKGEQENKPPVGRYEDEPPAGTGSEGTLEVESSS